MDAKRIVKTVEKIAQKYNGDKNNYKIKPLNMGSANLTTSLFKITIPTDNNELKLFAKVAEFGPEIRKQINGDRFFKTEIFFYEKISKIYDKIQDSQNFINGDRLKFPKSYGFDDEYLNETVILEDLVAEGYSCHNNKEYVSWEYAALAMEELAKFHALSLAYCDRYPEDYQNTIEELTKVKPQFANYGTLIDDIAQVVREEDKEIFCKVSKIFGKEMFIKWFSKGKREFINHGDFRSSNMLHRIKNGKLELQLLDFQVLHPGSPVSDILYFIITSTDKKFRDKHFQDIFDHYYRHLGLKLKLLNLNVDNLYPRDVFDEEIKEYLPLSVFIPIYLWPYMYSDDQNAPSLSADATLETTKIVLSDKYVDALSEIIEEWKMWRII